MKTVTLTKGADRSCSQNEASLMSSTAAAVAEPALSNAVFSLLAAVAVAPRLEEAARVGNPPCPGLGGAKDVFLNTEGARIGPIRATETWSGTISSSICSWKEKG